MGLELIVKLPKEKLPFIGIVFEDTYQASSINRSSVNNYKNSIYQVVLEPKGDKLDLRLLCAGHGLNYLYENVKFNQEKVMKFLYITKNEQAFNFSHCVRNGDNLEVVKTMANRTLFVLKVDKLIVNNDLY